MQEFTVGTVLRRVGGMFRTHPCLLLGLAVVFVAIPQIAAEAVVWMTRSSTQSGDTLVSVVCWLGSQLLQAALVQVSVDGANRRPLRVGDLLGTISRRLFTTLIIAVLLSFAIGTASLLFVFPGLMLFCRWYVAIPVAIAERRGISASFGRSADLTNGVRWRIFGILLMMFVSSFAASFVFGCLGRGADWFFPTDWWLFTGTIMDTAVSMLLFSLLSAATYFELCESKEGAVSQEPIPFHI